MQRYQQWATSSQGAWVTATLLFLAAALEFATDEAWLAGLMIFAGVLNLIRARRRLTTGRTDT